MSRQTALVIIDVQEAFFSGPKAAYQATAILGRIHRLREQAQRAAVPVIYVQHDGDPDSPVAPGSAGWQIHARVAPTATDTVVRKRASDAFFETTLEHELQARGVRHVVLVGYKTQMCVDTTSRRATSLGYDVTLVRDAHTTTDGATLSAAQIIAHHNETLDDFGTDHHAIVLQDSAAVVF